LLVQAQAVFWSDYLLQPKDTADLLMPADGRFHPAELGDCPEPVRRYLLHSIAPGTPRLRSVRLDMVGHLKIGRWLPFRAQELLTPHHGFVWRARVAGVIVGSDRFIPGSGGMSWKLAGLIPFVRTSGPDVARSAAGRAGGEALWLPTALLPRFGVAWTAQSTHSIESSFTVDDVPLSVRARIDDTGAIRSLAFDRWGDPDNTGTWGWHLCGGEVTGETCFEGLTIASAGSFGWHYGTNRWPDGEFFRYRITAMTTWSGGDCRVERASSRDGAWEHIAERGVDGVNGHVSGT